MMAMELLAERMPVYEEGKDLALVHRVNKAGARRTEVWTLRAFAPGTLKFAPFTIELKDRMYTHNMSVHVELPKDAVPGNRVLALDGRNRGHLAHAQPRLHVPGAVGSLFWCIDRTQDASLANVFLVYCHVTASEVQVHIPGVLAKQRKFTKDNFPQVPMLTNKHDVPGMTKLVALDDKVIVRAREEDAARKREMESQAHLDALPKRQNLGRASSS